MQHLKLSNRHGGKVGEPGHARSIEQGFGVSALECLDHSQMLTFRVSIVKDHGYRAVCTRIYPVGRRFTAPDLNSP